MITTSNQQKKTLKKIESQIVQIQSQLQAMTIQKNAYILSIIEGVDADGSEYELDKHFNLEKVELNEED